MDFNLPEEAAMIRDMMRRFVQKEAIPLEMKLFSQAAASPEGRIALPDDARQDLNRKVRQMGLWGVTLPATIGGGGLDALSACLIDEELGYTFVPIEIGDVPTALYACQGDQVDRFLAPAIEGGRRARLALREPGVSGDLRGWSARVEAQAGGFVLNGVKLSLGGGPDDFYLVFALGPQAEENSVTCLAVEPDAPGLSVQSLNGRGGVRLIFDSCTVPAAQVIGEPGRGLSLGAEWAPLGALRLAARYVGIARRLLDLAATYARDWVSLGAPLAVRPAIRRALAEMQVDIEATRLLVWRAALAIDFGQASANQIGQVRVASAGLLKRAVDRAITAYGGPTSAEQHPELRMIRNLVPAATLDQALELGWAAIAGELLGPIGTPET
jgi:acyl-CoA dehydrogenase